jgi:hypothetical protein
MLADPWWVGTQSLPQSIVLRLIAFLILVILHKQACDAALNEKSLPPSYRVRLCDSDWIVTYIDYQSIMMGINTILKLYIC